MWCKGLILRELVPVQGQHDVIGRSVGGHHRLEVQHFRGESVRGLEDRSAARNHNGRLERRRFRLMPSENSTSTVWPALVFASLVAYLSFSETIASFWIEVTGVIAGLLQ